MPHLSLGDAAIYYEEYGHGTPLVLLHAGWGLGINGFAYQQDTLADEFRMIVPDRRGYGRSTRVEKLDADFHWQGALDMFALLDALNMRETLAWGHSDGAVIGAIMAITQPTRVQALVFEGGHLYGRKPLSQPIFEQVYRDPTALPLAAQTRLAEYHGQATWQHVIRNWAGAWLELGRREGDLYRGRLHEITCPALVIHGGQDPHTPVSEMEELTQRIPGARLSVYPQAGHCVHDARLHCANCTQEAREFFGELNLAKVSAPSQDSFPGFMYTTEF